MFDPLDPFPLLSDDFSYEESKVHAEQVDQWLGLRIFETELEIREQKKYMARSADESFQYWTDFSPQVFQTPYLEIRQMLSRLNLRPGQTVIDLGAAYGRMAHVIGRHYPEVKFIGYEVVEERVRQGLSSLNLFNYPFVSLQVVDLTQSDFGLMPADFYFMYDFGDRRAIEIILDKLLEIAKTKSVTVIGRGRASRDAIERGRPWLSQVNTPKHFPHYSIYQS